MNVVKLDARKSNFYFFRAIQFQILLFFNLLGCEVRHKVSQKNLFIVLFIFGQEKLSLGLLGQVVQDVNARGQRNNATTNTPRSEGINGFKDVVGVTISDARIHD